MNGVLVSRDGKVLVCYPHGRSDTVYCIPSGITEIALYAFYQNRKLEMIVFPRTLRCIGGGHGLTVRTCIRFPFRIRSNKLVHPHLFLVTT